MSKSFVAALAAVVLAIATVPTTAYAQVSTAAAKPMKAVQDAISAKQWGEVPGKVDEVLKVSGKTTFDTLTAYKFLAYAYQMQGNSAKVIDALQGQMDSGGLSPAETNKAVSDMLGLSLQVKNYPQAVELGNRQIRSGAATAETYDYIALALMQQGKSAEAMKFLSDYVAEQEKRGQKPRETTLTRLRDLQDKSGNRAGAADTLEKLVIHYPKPDYWNLVTYTLARDPKLTERQTMHLYRLKVATQTLKRCQDYTEMADFAINSNMAGEGENPAGPCWQGVHGTGRPGTPEAPAGCGQPRYR
jgi:tetratricopeptide (TPR) repeat protein